jgi:putative transposase
LLQDYGIMISMTENGDPLDNAIAERVNGILKIEWIRESKISDLNEAKTIVSNAINVYNRVC